MIIQFPCVHANVGINYADVRNVYGADYSDLNELLRVK